MVTPKRRFRLSLRALLVGIALVATLLYCVDLNQSRVLYGHKSAQFSFGPYNVDKDFDFELFSKTLNSKPWRDDFRKQYPDHTLLLNTWDSERHGFKVFRQENVSSVTFKIAVRVPLYCVRLREFRWGWPFYTDKFIENGEEGVEKRMGDLNSDVYLQLLEHVSLTMQKQH